MVALLLLCPVLRAQTVPATEEGEVVMKLTQANASEGVTSSGADPEVMKASHEQGMTLWGFQDPKITATHYAVTGEIRCEDVSNGYLEMGSWFAPEVPDGLPGCFNTRALSNPGILQTLQGTSDWKPFSLPFDASQRKSRLTSLAINLKLADRGTVYLRNVRLVQYPDDHFPKEWAPEGTIPAPTLPVWFPKSADSPVEATSDALEIELGNGGKKITVAGVDYPSVESLRSVLKEKLAAKTDGAVVIKADQSVPYAKIVEVMNLCSGVQAKTVTFSVIPSQPIPNTENSAPKEVSSLPPGQMLQTVFLNELPQKQNGVTFTWEVPSGKPDALNTFQVTYSGKEPRLVELKMITDTLALFTRRLVTHHYALVGEVKTEEVTPGSYLEMWSYFASTFQPGIPDSRFFSRGLAASGPMGKLDGTQAWREFWLPFDSTGAKGKVNRIDFNLQLTGPGKVWLRNVKLMQYEDPAPIAATDNPLKAVTAPSPEATIHWRSFFLGVLASALGALAGAGLIRLLRQIGRRRHEQELRRIASLDG